MNLVAIGWIMVFAGLLLHTIGGLIFIAKNPKWIDESLELDNGKPRKDIPFYKYRFYGVDSSSKEGRWLSAPGIFLSVVGFIILINYG